MSAAPLPHYQDAVADSYGPALADLVNARAGHPASVTHIRHLGPAIRVGATVNVFRCGVCGASHGGLVLRSPVPGALADVTHHATCPRTGITLDLSLS